MADDDDSEKTEEPSERKKDKARQEGQVAYTKEVSSTLGFVAIVYSIYIYGMDLFFYVRQQFIYTFSNLRPWNYGTIPTQDIMPVLTPILSILMIIMAASFIGPVVGHVLQKGISPMLDAAGPKLSKMDPIAGTKQLFSVESLIMFVKNLVKTIGFMYIFYLSINPYLDKILYIASMPFEESIRLSGWLFARFLMYATGFLIALAALDYFINWRRIHNLLMMSRHEMKEEMKDSGGNPQIKGEFRQIAHERARKQNRKEVPQATVIVTNPTHFAVALKYKKGEVSVPMVVAKGADVIAKHIRELATEHGVPIIENPPLARALYREVKVGKEIPYKFYKTVAKIIAAILRLEDEKKLKRQGKYSGSASGAHRPYGPHP